MNEPILAEAGATCRVFQVMSSEGKLCAMSGEHRIGDNDELQKSSISCLQEVPASSPSIPSFNFNPILRPPTKRAMIGADPSEGVGVPTS